MNEIKQGIFRRYRGKESEFSRLKAAPALLDRRGLYKIERDRREIEAKGSWNKISRGTVILESIESTFKASRTAIRSIVRDFHLSKLHRYNFETFQLRYKLIRHRSLRGNSTDSKKIRKQSYDIRKHERSGNIVEQINLKASR